MLLVPSMDMGILLKSNGDLPGVQHIGIASARLSAVPSCLGRLRRCQHHLQLTRCCHLAAVCLSATDKPTVTDSTMAATRSSTSYQ